MTENPGRRVPVFLLVVLAVLWLATINQLRVEWTINEQYAYGWAVPFLALYLFSERWKWRPAPSRQRLDFLTILAAAPLILTLLPLRLIQAAAPDWRLISWAITGVAVGLSWCALYRVGGRSWLTHFFFPVAFVLVAVPWPVPFENALVQKLMHSVASICVEALGWWGIPALQRGNVIEIAAGVVGVEEACSGVRSLQTTLMAALFLGELLCFGWPRRAALLGSGLALAFVCNAGRAFALVWITSHEGPAGVAKWHDSIGLTVLVISLAGLAGLAALLRPHTAPPAVDLPAQGMSTRQVPRPVLIGLAAWLLAVEAGTEIWYRVHERAAPAPQTWNIAWPVDRPKFEDLEISEVTRNILLYSEGRSARWMNADGSQWSLVFIKWFPGRTSSQLARSHGPEVCMPATGAILRADHGVAPMKIREFELPVHAYDFDARGRPLYIFYCLWEDRPTDTGPKSTFREMDAQSRLKDVFAGQRNLGQQVLLLSVSGPADADEARSKAAELLAEIIR